MAKRSEITVALGDPHCPFLDRKAFQRVVEQEIPWVRQTFGPIRNFVWMGDMLDQFAYTKFPARIRLTAEDELTQGREQLEEAWSLLRRACGTRTKFWMLLGNHDERAYKRALERFPEILALTDFKGLYAFSGVETLHDPREPLILDEVVYTHGHKTKWGAHLPEFEYRPIVYGHTHRAGIMPQRVSWGKKGGFVTWEANPGLIGNPFAPELRYRPTNKFFTWTQGLIIVVDRHPFLRIVGRIMK